MDKGSKNCKASFVVISRLDIMRFLIVLGLLILLYYLVKGWISPSKPRQMGRGGGELESEMVQDLHCKTYIPKDAAIHTHINGRDYYFCSRQCMREFKREMGKIQSEGGGNEIFH
jgi:uncharacterized protein